MNRLLNDTYLESAALSSNDEVEIGSSICFLQLFHPKVCFAAKAAYSTLRQIGTFMKSIIAGFQALKTLEMVESEPLVMKTANWDLLYIHCFSKAS